MANQVDIKAERDRKYNASRRNLLLLYGGTTASFTVVAVAEAVQGKMVEATVSAGNAGVTGFLAIRALKRYPPIKK
jgi:hypothetical protein